MAKTVSPLIVVERYFLVIGSVLYWLVQGMWIFVIESRQQVIVQPVDIIRLDVVYLGEVHFSTYISKPYVLRAITIESRLPQQDEHIEGMFLQESCRSYFYIGFYK